MSNRNSMLLQELRDQVCDFTIDEIKSIVTTNASAMVLAKALPFSAGKLSLIEALRKDEEKYGVHELNDLTHDAIVALILVLR